MIDRKYQRKVLQGYLAAVLLVLTGICYLVLAGTGFKARPDFVVITLLLVVLVSVNTVHAIIELRALDYLDDTE